MDGSFAHRRNEQALTAARTDVLEAMANRLRAGNLAPDLYSEEE